MYRCSLTGFFSKVNDKMVYEKDKTVIMNIEAPDDSSNRQLVNLFMTEMFAPNNPVDFFPLHAHRVGGLTQDDDDNRTRVFTFYKKNDRAVNQYIYNDGATIIESDRDMTFKITRLSDYHKAPDGFGAEPYLDVYDVLMNFVNDQSAKFESLGYALPEVSVVDEQIIFHSLTAIDLFMPYPSSDSSIGVVSSVSCVNASSYVVIDMLVQSNQYYGASGSIQIFDTVTETGKFYHFDNFIDFFNDQRARDTIAHNHQSLIVDQASGTSSYIIALSHEESVNPVKILIKLDSPESKLSITHNPSATGDATNVVSACLNPNNFVQA